MFYLSATIKIGSTYLTTTFRMPFRLQHINSMLTQRCVFLLLIIYAKHLNSEKTPAVARTFAQCAALCHANSSIWASSNWHMYKCMRVCVCVCMWNLCHQNEWSWIIIWASERYLRHIAQSKHSTGRLAGLPSGRERGWRWKAKWKPQTAVNNEAILQRQTNQGNQLDVCGIYIYIHTCITVSWLVYVH